ncbi:MAG: hypothetical protein QOF10_3896 [Kribbellaceae bacterium]|nr:hypothetical protein [Kribbellaceae bacterium]
MKFTAQLTRRRALGLAIASVIVAAGLTSPTVSVGATAAATGTRAIPSGGTTSIRSGPTGVNGLQQPELRPNGRTEEGGAEANRARPGSNNSPFPDSPLPPPKVHSSAVARSNPDVAVSVNGLTHRDQRLANGGNQFSLEPPDQALCVGNGYVVEAVNSVLRVRSARTGAALSGVQDINRFYGYPAAINRTTGVIGPNVIDPVCLYDPDHGRFVVAITTLHVLPNGQFSGKNTIDVAVSNSRSPLGNWTIYHVPAQNDGTEGTPNHGCKGADGQPGPCFQDYPHIGADANGVYISTNEYDLFGPNYSAAQIFAFSKAQLAAHPSSVNLTLVEDLSVAGTPGFTVWPANSPKGEYSKERNGTEYLLSTIAGDGSETGNPTRTANKLGIWAITNTKSLNTATPALGITSRLTNSQTYVFPPKSTQKSGNIPLGQCINDKKLPTPLGPGCWRALFLTEPPHNEAESSPDSLDSRMQQTWYVNGTLWGSSGTAVKVKGELKAGIAWFAVSPKIDEAGQIEGKVKKQGYIALADNNLSMPAIAFTRDGKGAIAFSVMGEKYYPSAGYVRISENGSVGPIHIASKGLGPDDGFSGYNAFTNGAPRTRWGDYGAAASDGNTIWIASEYIGQTCTLAQYADFASFGSCGGTRTALANWYTRLTKLSQ